MEADPAYALQKAFYAILTGQAFQTACGVTVTVYDHIPEKAVAPYVVISDIQTDGDAAQAYDGSDVHSNIMVWSTKPGKVELGMIANQVRVFLAPRSDRGPPFDLTASGHRLITWKHQQTLRMDDTDGISVKAAVKIEYLTQPLS